MEETASKSRQEDIVLKLTSLRDLLFIFFKFKGLFFLIVLGALFGTMAYVYVKDPVYETSAKILVRSGHETAIPPSIITQPTVIQNREEVDVNNEMEILKNREIIERVITTLGLDQPEKPAPPPSGFFKYGKYVMKRAYREVKKEVNDLLIKVGLRDYMTPRETAVTEFIKGLKVERVKDSNIVEVKLAVRQKEHSSIILATLLKYYLERHYDAHQNPGVTDFFNEKTAAMKGQMEGAEKLLHAFKNKYNIVQLSEQKSLLLKRITDNEAALQKTRSEIAETEAKIREGQAALGDVTSRHAGGKAPSTAGKGYVGPEIHDRFGKDIYTAIRQSVVESQILLESLKNKRSAQMSDDQRYRQELNDYEQRELEYNDLARAVTVNEGDYIFYKKKQEEAKTVDAQYRHGIRNVVIIENPSDPLVPVGMKKSRILGIALGAGILAAIFIVMILESFDHAIYYPDQMEKLVTAPSLGTVRDKRVRWTEGKPVLNGQVASDYLAVLDQIAFRLKNSAHKQLLFTATGHREGTTTSVLNSAFLAHLHLGWKVLVVEMNQRSPAFSTFFPELPRAGVAALLRGETTGALRELVSTQEHFDVIPFGNSQQLFSYELLQQAADRIGLEIGPHYDCIMFDCAPALKYTDLLGIACGTGSVIVVTRFGKSRSEVLKRLVEQLSVHGISVFGTILNRYRRMIPEFIYRRL